MMELNAKTINATALNIAIDSCDDTDIIIYEVLGQRYIANASKDKKITLHGTAGNNLGSFLDGSEIELFGNAQEACGNTMNKGAIYVHGRCGDALGYGMRGGKLYIEGDCGSRCGIHMKAYQDQKPTIVIGGCAKDFLGEYLSGGTIVVLNLKQEAQCVGKYCGSGAHGGSIYLRMDDVTQLGFTKSEVVEISEKALQELSVILHDYEKRMKLTLPKQMKFYEVKMNTKNPYERLYVNQ